MRSLKIPPIVGILAVLIIISVLYGPTIVKHRWIAIPAAMEPHRESTNGWGVITALARLSKGCAAWVGVTALARRELGKRRATPPFLPSGSWDEHHLVPEGSCLTAVAWREEPYNDRMQLTAPASMERCS